jgi:sec-independent protein translocase protein TatA
MFGFSTPALVVIGLILLVIFGPAKLPQLGSSLGNAIRNFRKAGEEETNTRNEGKGADAV